MVTFDVDGASTALTENGIVIDDPEAPFFVRIGIEMDGEAPRISELNIVPKNGHTIRRHWLTTLPLRELQMAAVSIALGSDYVNESYYRRIAAGGRAPLDSRVAAVAAWAEVIKRPGGQARAIAEFWGIHERTARRWLRLVRERAAAAAASAREDQPTLDSEAPER